jgi:hypothetical protein
MQGVDIVDVLLPFIDLSLNPVAIQVSEQMVDVLGGGGVPYPFPDVKGEQGFVGMDFGLLEEFFEVCLEVIDELVVELLTEKVRCTDGIG